ncbi:Golgi apyrase [Chytriomyces hyalinus]|nr:Golgi apyrase [Chytriomyces hyalinus]
MVLLPQAPQLAPGKVTSARSDGESGAVAVQDVHPHMPTVAGLNQEKIPCLPKRTSPLRLRSNSEPAHTSTSITAVHVFSLLLVCFSAIAVSWTLFERPRSYHSHSVSLKALSFSSVDIISSGSSGNVKITVLQSSQPKLWWDNSCQSCASADAVTIGYGVSNDSLTVTITFPSLALWANTHTTNVFLSLPDTLQSFSATAKSASLIWRGPKVVDDFTFSCDTGAFTVVSPLHSKSATIAIGSHSNRRRLLELHRFTRLTKAQSGVLVDAKYSVHLFGLSFFSYDLSGLFVRMHEPHLLPPSQVAVQQNSSKTFSINDPDSAMLALNTGFPFSVNSVGSMSDDDWYSDRNYGIVIDAGSSGSRLLIYSWKSFNAPSHNSSALPVIEKAFPNDSKPWSTSVEPGISSLATLSPSNLPTFESTRKYLRPLLRFAEKTIPKHLHRKTPIYLFATAGMRLVPQEAQDLILHYACRVVQERYQFDVTGGCSRQFRIISGEAEGIFGWVTVNYLHGGFQDPSKQNPLPREGSPPTYGFLDMGGASMQIAFEPMESMKKSHADDLTRFNLRTAGGHEMKFEVFVSTFLGFGVNEARRRYVEGIATESGFPLKTAASPIKKPKNVFYEMQDVTPISPTLSDPCLPLNLQLEPDRYIQRIRNPRPTLVGTGNLPECLQKLNPYLRKSEPCKNEPCLFNGVHAPIDDIAKHRFIGVSEYYYTPTAVQGAGSYHFDEFLKNAEIQCRSTWRELSDMYLELNPGTSKLSILEEQRLKLRCFKSAWVLEVLHDGFGIPKDQLVESDTVSGENREATSFQPAMELNGFPISWTLGAMLFHVSSIIPPNQPN